MPLITLLTDMVSRCRLLAAHGLRSCLSVRTQPLTATGAPSQTSTMPYHTMPCTVVPIVTTHRPCNFFARNKRIHEDVGAALALPSRLPPGITKLQQDRMKVARAEKCELLSKNDCSCPPHVWLGAAVATGLKLHMRAEQRVCAGRLAQWHTPETHKT